MIYRSSADRPTTMEDHTSSNTNGEMNTDSNHGNGLHIDDVNEEILSDLLGGVRIDHSLQCPDMKAVKLETFDRTHAAMAAIHPTIANKILPHNGHASKEESAAICIQSQIRGFLARKKYVQLLFELYAREEEERYERIRQQVEEGDLLIDNYRLKCEMDENACLRRNLRRNRECSATMIQRAWRKHKGKSFDYSDGGHDACQDHLLGDQSVVHIRTNPFSDQESDDEDDGNSDISNDSLEQSNEVNNYKNNQECNPDQEGIDSDLYSDEALGLDAVTTPIDLLSPTTDWESIESCLKSQGGGQDYDNNDLTDLQKKKLTDFKLKANNLQICFVDDDGMLSDADGSVDGCEVREYIINKQDLSEEEKRDSGCVAGDEEGTEPFSIKTVNPEVLENTRVSPEDLQQVMLELSGQDSDEELEERSRYQGWTRERLEELTLEELKELRNNMSQVIAAQNEVLVQELMSRDRLHLKQDSLLMEVEDSSKLAQTKYKMAQKVQQKS